MKNNNKELVNHSTHDKKPFFLNKQNPSVKEDPEKMKMDLALEKLIQR